MGTCDALQARIDSIWTYLTQLLPVRKETLGKRGKSSGMSNHTLSECLPTLLKPKPLQAILLVLITYQAFL